MIHNLTCSATASEVTTLSRYRNECIIIIIIEGDAQLL